MCSTGAPTVRCGGAGHGGCLALWSERLHGHLQFRTSKKQHEYLPLALEDEVLYENGRFAITNYSVHGNPTDCGYDREDQVVGVAQALGLKSFVDSLGEQLLIYPLVPSCLVQEGAG